MKVADRCDKCGAQAYVEVVSQSTGFTLMFCGHDYKSAELVLMSQGFKILEDDREKLLERPGVSAAS